MIDKHDQLPRQYPAGGGTDLNPVFKEFEKIEKEYHGKGNINFVVLTDGEIPPLRYGPRVGKTVILTTSDTIQFEGSAKPYLNINIDMSEE